MLAIVTFYQESTAVCQPRLSLKFKHVWMLKKIYLIRGIAIFDQKSLPGDFIVVKRLISLRLTDGWRAASKPCFLSKIKK